MHGYAGAMLVCYASSRGIALLPGSDSGNGALVYRS